MKWMDVQNMEQGDMVLINFVKFRQVDNALWMHKAFVANFNKILFYALPFIILVSIMIRAFLV